MLKSIQNRITISLLLFVSINFLNAQAWDITPLATMPVPVSNNAVSEGFSKGDAFAYSFAGIDSTRIYSGIHNRSFRYDFGLDIWEEIDPLPDPRGKIACSANRIDSIIYIVGGYYVNPDGSEISSRLVHRFNTEQNQFLSDAKPIPVPIDDQVQAVWRDSLLFVITGWSNNTNVTNVQIYNPVLDSWKAGTSLPNVLLYKVFGASGIILEDSIYYFGGARLGNNFPANYGLIKGVINPDDPTDISWTDISPDLETTGYRTACTRVGKDIHWVGGSAVSYNYDGIAYNGTGAVSPLGKIRILNKDDKSMWFEYNSPLIPMDLRGLASINDSTKILCGGMQSGPQVSDKTLLLNWSFDPSLSVLDSNIEEQSRIFPNPVYDEIHLILRVDYQDDKLNYTILDSGLKVNKKGEIDGTIPVSDLQSGVYLLVIEHGTDIEILKFHKV